MMGRGRNCIGVMILFSRLLSAPVRGHDTSIQFPPPQSVGEAWNVIEESKTNVDQLLQANLMRDIGGQLVNIGTALRFLSDHADGPRSDVLRNQSISLITAEAGLLRATRELDDPQSQTRVPWKTWCDGLDRLESLYPNDVVHAQVYICPLHPLDRHLNPADKCSICGMSLVRRHVPASAVYQRPGEPTLKVTALSPPLVIGYAAIVTLRFAKPDGTPVLLSELIETHTKKIHLLINNRSLGDYHHEHPAPTATPGEYQFSFTPTRPGPYRIWADVVPAWSGVQEYDIVDLPAQTSRGAISDRKSCLTRVIQRRIRLHAAVS